MNKISKMKIGSFRCVASLKRYTSDDDIVLSKELFLWKCSECGTYRIATEECLASAVPEPVCQGCRQGTTVFVPYKEEKGKEKAGNVLVGFAYRGITPSVLVRNRDGFRTMPIDSWKSA